MTEIPFPAEILPPPKIRGLIPAQKPKRAKPQPFSVKPKAVDRGSQADMSPIPPTDSKQQNECIKIIQSFASQCLSKMPAQPKSPDQQFETLTSANEREKNIVKATIVDYQLELIDKPQASATLVTAGASSNQNYSSQYNCSVANTIDVPGQTKIDSERMPA